MVAMATWGYILAQHKDAQEAEARLLAAATNVFGAERAAEIIKNVKKTGLERCRVENPEFFEFLASQENLTQG